MDNKIIECRTQITDLIESLSEVERDKMHRARREFRMVLDIFTQNPTKEGIKRVVSLFDKLECATEEYQAKLDTVIDKIKSLGL